MGLFQRQPGAGSQGLYKELGEKERVAIYQIDPGCNTAHAVFAYDLPGKYLVPGTITDPQACCREPALKGVRVPVRPHLGTAGVAPDVAGRVSTIPPGAHGGNIDNWRIGAGATMYCQVAVDGALFSIGDPHISQGDGELSGTAIEASLDVLLEIVLRKDFSFPSPLSTAGRASTAACRGRFPGRNAKRFDPLV